VSQASNRKRPVGIYLIIVWMAINLVLLALMIPGDHSDLNNYIEPILWAASMAGLLTMKKAGAAFATSVLCITLSTSMFNVLIAYYTGNTGEPVAYVNALRIVINAVTVVYMFKSIFAGKFK
jgi:hypothetical protein